MSFLSPRTSKRTFGGAKQTYCIRWRADYASKSELVIVESSKCRNVRVKVGHKVLEVLRCVLISKLIKVHNRLLFGMIYKA
jgi:hypothetical protein